MMMNHFHVIKDPVHGTMQFTRTENAWLKPFIDSPPFQRLRHIKQLGLGDFIFPGAVHTRFNHCLGCCYLSSQITQKIGLAPYERQLVMIACLLHDIGHGPFSHAFEGIFHEKLIRHEDWTPYFLSEYKTETFFKYYTAINPDYPLTEDNFHMIANMILHKSVCDPVLADIVSSQLDADRLDYLLRDSHFCGVRYGEFDLAWMLHCMTIVPFKTGKRLGVTYKGIGIVEHYLMARRLMLRNIYHSHKKLAFEFFLVRLLISLSENIDDFAPYRIIRETRLGQFLLAVHQFNELLSDQTIQEDKKRFLENNYCHFKALCDYDISLVIEQLCALEFKHEAIELAKRLYHRKMPKIIPLEINYLTHSKPIITDFKASYARHFQDWQIAVIEFPHQAYSGTSPILVIDEEGIVHPISNTSDIIQSMFNKQEQVSFLCIDQAIIDDKQVQHLVKQLYPKHFKRRHGVDTGEHCGEMST